MLRSQSLQDGIKLLGYEKYKMAKDVLQKLYDANPKDAKTIYWLGQAFITSDDVPAAKRLYEKAMNDGVNDPLIWIGLGHVQLLESDDINAAKQKFEQAITQTTPLKGRNKGKPDPDILNAIGRANAFGHPVTDLNSSKFGDPLYGIEKLKQAETIDLTNPDIAINEGLNYRKMGSEYGGEAQKAFEEAIRRDPKNARAMYLIGKIYVTQNNKESLEAYFNRSINADPAFAPAYLELFKYYADKDVNKAKEYIDNFLKYADKDPKNDFFYADYLFRAGKYRESLDKAKEIESSAGIDKVPELNILYAYNYDRLKDSVLAKSYIEKYFAAVPAGKTQSADYNLAISVLSKFPGNEEETIGYIKKAIALDTTAANKIKFMDDIARIYGNKKDYAGQLNWLKQAAALKTEISNRDYYFLCDAAMKANDTIAANQLSAAYALKYKDEIYPLRFKAMAAIATDYDTSKGSAIPAVEAYIAFLSKDAAKYKRILPYQFYYLAGFYHDKQKDYAKALETLNRLIAIYPDDKYALSVKPIVEKEIAGNTSKKTTAKGSASGG